MVKIRLMRVGKKKQPSYRVVVADARSPRDGRIIEALGHYHPRSQPSEIVIDADRARYWLDRGAQPTDPVRRLLQIAEQGGAPPEEKVAARKATAAASVVEETPETDEAGTPGAGEREGA